MNICSRLLVIVVLGLLTESASGKNDTAWKEAIAKVYEGWRTKDPYVKKCDRSEVLGFCPKKQLTACLLGHVSLKTVKMCDHCSVEKWYAYKFGECPDEELVKIGRELGFVYNVTPGKPEELRLQHNLLRQIKRKEKRHNQKHEIDFQVKGSGSGVENPEPVELSIEKISPKTGGQSSSENNEIVDLEFLGKIPDKPKAVGAKITKNSSVEKLKKLLRKITQLF